jgi:hypothetical protein
MIVQVQYGALLFQLAPNTVVSQHEDPCLVTLTTECAVLPGIEKPQTLKWTFKREPRMTVGELRKKLEDIESRTKFLVPWKIDSGPTYFAVSDVSLPKGIASRVDGTTGFRFGRDGSPPWLRSGCRRPIFAPDG